MTLRTTKIRGDFDRRAGFTLIELILVMALLVILTAVVTPRMGGFFRGRALDYEARRFTTLTRYAQNRAVTEGIPMMVWLDEASRRYGLQAQPGFLENDAQAVEYTLSADLELEVRRSLSGNEAAATPLISRTLTSAPHVIRIGPDGFISEESPDAILIRRADDQPVVMVPSRTWQNYETTTNHQELWR